MFIFGVFFTTKNLKEAANIVNSSTGIFKDFLSWYESEDSQQLGHWQRRIAASDVIFEANELVDYWLLEADQLVPSLPRQLHTVTQSLVDAVKQKKEIKHQGLIA